MNNNRFLIHDLTEQEADIHLGTLPSNMLSFAAKPKVKPCVGCFSCWIKTPGICIIKDRSQETPALLAKSNEMIIISRNLYGGYSPEIKAVLDRHIGYIMPYFRIINDEMHHTMRYENPFNLRVHFYGLNIGEEEKSIAKMLVAANAVNLGAGSHKVEFHNSLEHIKEILL